MQSPDIAARQKAKTLLLTLSVTATLTGWGVISVVHPPVLAAQAQILSIGSQRLTRSNVVLASVTQSTARPEPIAITRSSR
jgi:hypothetical protein